MNPEELVLFGIVEAGADIWKKTDKEYMVDHNGW